MTLLFVIIIALIALVLYLYFRPGRQRPLVNTSYIEGLIAELEGDIDLAIKKFKEAVSMDTNLVDAYIRLGNLYRRKGDISRAIQIHQSLTVRPTLKKDVEKRIFFALVEDYLDYGRPNKAASVLKEILKIDKNDHSAIEQLLHIYETLGNFQDCVGVIEEYNGQINEERRAFYYASLAKSKLSDTDEDIETREKEAVGLFKKALKIKPDSIAALNFWGEYYRNKGDLKKAREYYLKIAERHPDWTFLIIENFEKVSFETGTFEEIIPLYEKIFKSNPKNFSVGFALAELYEKKNEREQAKEVYRKLSELYPKSPLPKIYLLNLASESKTIKGEVGELLRFFSEPKFVCKHCGTSTNKFTFLCPKCHSIETYLPHL